MQPQELDGGYICTGNFLDVSICMDLQLAKEQNTEICMNSTCARVDAHRISELSIYRYCLSYELGSAVA